MKASVIGLSGSIMRKAAVLATATLMSLAAGAAIGFVDRTRDAGLTELSFGGYGSSWADFNGDGLLDVWISNHMYRPTLYINQGDGTFLDATSRSWQGTSVLDAHGGAWGDFDNDGDPDLIELYGVDGGTSFYEKPFYVNEGGTLVDQAAARGLDEGLSRGRTPLWLDWNGDGLLDLYMVNFMRPHDDLSPSRMLIQQDNGSFLELPAMTKQGKSFFAQLAFFDGGVHMVTQGGPYPNAVYRLGNSTPMLVELQPNKAIWGVADVAVADFDNDLSDDLLIVRTASNVSGVALDPTTRRVLNLSIQDITSSGGAVISFKGPSKVVLAVYDKDWLRGQIRVGKTGHRLAEVMRTTIDYRRRRWLEVTMDATDSRFQGIMREELRSAPGIYVGRLATGEWQMVARGTNEHQISAQLRSLETAEIQDVQLTGFQTGNLAQLPALLFRTGQKFTERAVAWGLDHLVSCESVVAADFDNDMDVDVYMACSDVLGNVENRLYENVGGRFQLVPGAGGAATRNEGTGGRVSVADYDNDGYMDLLVTDGRANLGYPFHFGRRFLLKNLGGINNWIKFKLIGCQSNRDAVGARVRVLAGGKWQARTLGGGMHNGVQDDPRPNFGLAGNTEVHGAVVDWPSGATTTLSGLAPNKIYTVHEDPASACH